MQEYNLQNLGMKLNFIRTPETNKIKKLELLTIIELYKNTQWNEFGMTRNDMECPR
jgi:hypothetical protein